MWKYCGVIKDKNLLEIGLDKIIFLQNKSGDINVNVLENNCQDLIEMFELQSSLLSAEATIISALERNESRGSHQRSDFIETNSSFEFNCCVNFEDINNKIRINRLPLKKLNKKLKIIIENEILEEDIGNKLLE